MGARTLYLIGLILVILYISTGIDDFIWDVITIFKRIRNKQEVLNFKDLDDTPPKLIAIVIAAWHEDNVLYDVVENIVNSQQYPKTMYHVFLGVYPNDKATVYVAKELEKKYFNVHCIVNYKDGPTSKAQNINYVISEIKEFEKINNWKFKSVTVHDSEDVVHPFELKVTNYLLEKHDAIQFPVIPLLKKPTLSNFFSNLTTSTYADEFAENHFITMVSRRNAGAFVPSAGTGFSISRDTIDILGYSVLPEKSITEDYKLSLILYKNGVHMHYVLEKLERLNFQGKKDYEFIATRSMFPDTFKAAVQQKTRWTLGITMQSLKTKDIFNKNLSFAGKYSLYRDQKAKIGNLLSMVGYPVLIYFITSLFISLTPIYPKYTFSWYLCLIVTIMMLERQLFRAISLKNIYGFRSVFYGCLFPPIIPIRIIWGNIINLVATVRAYGQFILGKNKAKETEPQNEEEKVEQYKKNNTLADEISEQEETIEFEWSKTDHVFLEKDILARFHRRIGDILIAKKYIELDALKTILEEKDNLEEKNNKGLIGKYLLSKEFITEEQFLDALSEVKNIPLIKKESLDLYDLKNFSDSFEKEFLLENMVLPLFKSDKGYVFAYGASSPLNTQSLLRSKYKLDNQTILATDDCVLQGINTIFEKETTKQNNAINDHLKDGYITSEQIVIMLNYISSANKSEDNIGYKMGVVSVNNEDELQEDELQKYILD